MPFPDQNWPYSLFLSQRSSAGLRLYQPGVGEGAVLTIIPGVNTTITCIDSFEIAAVTLHICSIYYSSMERFSASSPHYQLHVINISP